MLVSLFIIFVIPVTIFAADCDVRCSGDKFPCGIFMDEDYSHLANGIYLISKTPKVYNKVNLKCTMKSRPKTVSLNWYYFPHQNHAKEHGADDFMTEAKKVECENPRKNIVCEGTFATTKSECVMNVKYLNQTGRYFCRGKLDGHVQDSVISDVKVYGVSEIQFRKNSGSRNELDFGEPGSLRVIVCSHPKPNVVWINKETGMTVQTGQSNGKYSALPLRHILEPANHSGGPAKVSHYCQQAQLLISKVEESDARFNVIASTIGQLESFEGGENKHGANKIPTEHELYLYSFIRGVPKSGAMCYTFSIFIVLFCQFILV